MVDIKICNKCKRELSVSSFNWKHKNIKRSYSCRDCSREYIREHYKNNLDYYLKKAKRRNLQIRNQAKAHIAKHLLANPCVDCGENDILVLEFDHIDPKLKLGEVSRISRGFTSMRRVVQEIAKCEVRRANCHRRKTAKEDNSWRLSFASVA